MDQRAIVDAQDSRRVEEGVEGAAPLSVFQIVHLKVVVQVMVVVEPVVIHVILDALLRELKLAEEEIPVMSLRALPGISVSVTNPEELSSLSTETCFVQQKRYVVAPMEHR